MKTNLTAADSANQAQDEIDIISKIILKNDLSGLTPTQQVQYYHKFCESLGLNPLTQPFHLLKFNGKIVLYAAKDATEQLRKIHGVSVMELEKVFQNDLYIVTAKVQDKAGRYDASTGVVSIKGLYGDNLANAIMKAETKAKRRATLSICGLGMLDESEIETVGPYQKIDVKTGEVIETKGEAIQHQQPKIKQTEKNEQTESTSSGDFIMPIGRNKGRKICELDDKDLQKTVEWCREKEKFPNIIEAIERYLFEKDVGFQASPPTSDFNEEQLEFIKQMEDIPQ
jgi:hypothetical protein